MQQQQYVGIDLHRRRSVIVRMNDAGEVVEVSKIDNDPVAFVGSHLRSRSAISESRGGRSVKSVLAECLFPVGRD